MTQLKGTILDICLITVLIFIRLQHLKGLPGQAWLHQNHSQHFITLCPAAFQGLGFILYVVTDLIFQVLMTRTQFEGAELRSPGHTYVGSQLTWETTVDLDVQRNLHNCGQKGSSGLQDVFRRTCIQSEGKKHTFGFLSLCPLLQARPISLMPSNILRNNK